MKIVTNDYGCGTSSSILDYDIEDVVVVSKDNWEHIFDIDDDLLFTPFTIYPFFNKNKPAQTPCIPAPMIAIF